MHLLVTGATGLLGNNIVRQAIERGWTVTALVRGDVRRAGLDQLPVQLVAGDLTQPEVVDKVVGKVDAVVHSAAHLHIGWWHLETARQVNRDGTATLAKACRQHGVRLLHVSTVNTLPISTPQRIIDEESSGDGQIPCTYVVTKKEADRQVEAELAEGLDAVWVHPGFMLGPWDWKPSSGRMFLEVAHRPVFFVPPGGCSVCDVRDVADGTLRALERSPSGRRYILAGHNVTYQQLWEHFLRLVGKPQRTAKVGWGALKMTGWVGDMISYPLRQELSFNSAATAMSRQFHWASSHRATKELGYHNRPLEETLQAMAAWMSQQGYLKRPLASAASSDN
jgi:dihydroflavonol-4-reductase